MILKHQVRPLSALVKQINQTIKTSANSTTQIDILCFPILTLFEILSELYVTGSIVPNGFLFAVYRFWIQGHGKLVSQMICCRMKQSILQNGATTGQRGRQLSSLKGQNRTGSCH